MAVMKASGAGAMQHVRPHPMLGLVRALASAAGRCGAWIRAAARRSAGRRALALLNDRLLRDIGLTRAEAEMEAGKPFWLD